MRDTPPDCAIGFLDVSNLLLLVAAWRTGIRVIVSDRNNPKFHRCNLILLRALKRLVYRRASLIVAQTQDVAEWACLSYRVPTAVIPNILVVQPTAVRVPSKTIAALGRLIPVKGHDVLLRAFACAARELRGWELVIGGSGPEGDALIALARELGIHDSVQFVSDVSDPADFYSRTEIFVLPSRSEGYPNVLLEAMACGCAVIASNCPSGPSQLIADSTNGLLFPVNDYIALAAALKKLAHDPQLRELMGNCARQVTGYHSEEAIMPKWNAVIAHSPTSAQIPAPAMLKPR